MALTEMNKRRAQVRLCISYSLSKLDYFCSHNKQKELPPAVPEAIVFTAAGITMNNIVRASPAFACGSPGFEGNKTEIIFIYNYIQHFALSLTGC